MHWPQRSHAGHPNVRLLQVIPYYLPAIDFGGPVSVCAKLAEAMVRRGHAVTVLTTDAASRVARVPALEEQRDGVRIVRLRNLSQALVRTNLYTPWRTRSTLAELLSSSQVVHVHEFFTWLTFRSTTEAARQRRPVLLSGHGSVSMAPERGRVGIKRVWLSTLGGRTIAASNLVQAATQHEAEQCVRAGIAREKIRLIPQGVQAPPRSGSGAAFRARFGLDDRPILLFVGRLLESKGVDLLLRAAQRFAEHPLRPLFVLVGPPENRPDLGPGPRGSNVLLTGRLDQAQLQDAYAAAAAFVLPSFAEGMPMTALDALAFGLPAVLSRACNLPEVAEAGAGILVDPDLESLTRGLERLLSQPDAWPRMGAAARELAATRFDTERVHDAYERIYEELAHA
jgi:glycosyltransferase involved in cell wall biosynthesis